MSPPASAYSLAPMEGNLFASASVAIARKLAANSPSWVTTSESTRLLAMAAKAGLNSLGLCAGRDGGVVGRVRADRPRLRQRRAYPGARRPIPGSDFAEVRARPPPAAAG